MGWSSSCSITVTFMVDQASPTENQATCPMGSCHNWEEANTASSLTLPLMETQIILISYLNQQQTENNNRYSFITCLTFDSKILLYRLRPRASTSSATPRTSSSRRKTKKNQRSRTRRTKQRTVIQDSTQDEDHSNSDASYRVVVESSKVSAVTSNFLQRKQCSCTTTGKGTGDDTENLVTTKLEECNRTPLQYKVTRPSSASTPAA